MTASPLDKDYRNSDSLKVNLIATITMYMYLFLGLFRESRICVFWPRRVEDKWFVVWSIIQYSILSVRTVAILDII